MVLMTSTFDDEALAGHPEIAGRRVLVTGLTTSLGVDIARAFADNRARLVLHMADDGAEMQAVAEIAAASALDMRLYTGAIASRDDAKTIARAAAQCFGGLDIVVNLIDTAAIARPRRGADVEQQVANLLATPYLVSRIAANRMRLTMTPGLILNVVVPSTTTAMGDVMAAVTRATLATMTRREAEAWAGDGIRYNAVVPFVPGAEDKARITCEPDLATLALHLASRKGRELTGHVFSARLARA